MKLLEGLAPGPVLGEVLTHASVPFPSQAGCENPSISLHVIGLNGPTHDLEMMPPVDPRMRFASFPHDDKAAATRWGSLRVASLGSD